MQCSFAFNMALNSDFDQLKKLRDEFKIMKRIEKEFKWKIIQL